MTTLAGWLLFALAISILVHFIDFFVRRDERAVSEWHEFEWRWEEAEHNKTLLLLREAEDKLAAAQMDVAAAEYELAFALEQLYAKATLREAMDASIVVVSDVDLQALAADKGMEAAFTFDRLVTAALQDGDDDE